VKVYVLSHEAVPESMGYYVIRGVYASREAAEAALVVPETYRQMGHDVTLRHTATCCDVEEWDVL
jgi:hypothetical protein